MLTRNQIEALKIIQDASPGCFDKTSYNLRLGQEHVLIGGEKPEYRENAALGIHIPPFGCVLVSTLEWLRMPEEVCGRWGLKIRPALTGLIFQAGPQIEPNYVGKLFGLLFNLSAEERVLDPNKPLWSIDFMAIRGRKPKPLAADDTADVSIKKYLTPSLLAHGSPGQLFVEWKRLLDQATQIANERESRLEKQCADLKDINDKLRGLLTNKSDKWTLVLTGLFVVVICSFVPLGISKAMYDKDEFVNLVEGRGILEKLQGAVKAEMEAKDVKLQEFAKQIQAMKDQMAPQNKKTVTGNGTDPLPPPKVDAQPVDSQNLKAKEGAK